MRRFLARFLRDDDGATAVEYGLLLVLITLAIIGSVTLFGETFNGMAQRIADTLAARTPKD